MADVSRPGAIAIVGLAGRFPGARDLEAFWRNVRDGVEVLDELSEDDLDAAGVDPELRARAGYVRKTTSLEGADLFDAGFFGLSPREAQILDPQQRLFMECAWEAVEHAGYAGAVAGQSVGVYAGASMGTYAISQLLGNRPFVASVGPYQLMLGNDKDFLATRVSYKLDLRGPSMSIQTACSTSLVAVEVACRALQRGECDMALAGGVSIMFPQRGGYLFEEGMIFSPDGHCRPFDAGARGTRAGAGAGVVVLKRLADAVADRDTIHAVILGAAINNDGGSKAGYTAPSVEGQVEAIAMAQALAGVDPRTISYLEAHGTGTPLGDPIEIAALTQVFRAATSDTGFCRIGSLKANLGHLDVAAGVASLIKTVLALGHRELPPLVNFRAPNPQLGLERSPFVASAEAAPWTSAGAPRRAGVSAFGIGGTNAHVVLEEAPAVAPSVSARDGHLLVLSARTPAALDQATSELAGYLEHHPELSIADAAFTLQVGRETFVHRRAVVAADRTSAVAALRTPHRAPVLTGSFEGGTRPVAFVLSGQGSQHPGQGAMLYRGERAYREVVDRCAELLEPHLGLDLREILHGPAGEAAIHETRLAQPALFVTEVALAALWKQWGVVPAAMIGHSLGEWTAAHLAGVISLEDALAVVAARGRLMQAQPPGTMAAVHLPAADLERRLTGGVELAAVNAPGLCSISGPTEAVSALLERLQASGIEARPLHTSHAFHSAMMEPALAPFTALLEKVKLSAPAIPYVSNVTGTWITPEQATSPAYHARHLRQAVRFESGVRTLAANPALLLLEVGPGTALTTLARLTLGKDGPRRAFASLSHPRERRPDVESMLEAAGRAWTAGVALDWKGLHAEDSLRRVPLPTYPFERKRHWVDALPAAAAAAAGPRPTTAVEDMLFAPTWTRDDTPPPAARLEGTWLVLVHPGALADAIVARLADAGARPVVVEPGEAYGRLGADRVQVRPGSAEDLAAALRDADARGFAGAVYLWDLASPEAGRTFGWIYHSLIVLAAAVEASSRGVPVRIVVATAGAQSVLDEPVVRPDGALLLGPALVLPTEVPGLQTRLVDLEPAAGAGAHAAQLVDEAARDDRERVVARRGTRRWLRGYTRAPLPGIVPDDLPLRECGVVLITGGTGGIGLELARWLAASRSSRLLLTARTPLPPRERWDTWRAEHDGDDRIAEVIGAVRKIEAVGGEVLVAQADAADEVAMARAISLARAKWGSIDAVIHAAGVAGSGVLAFRKPTDEVQAVFAPKVDGLAVLVKLLGGEALDFVALLSSVNAVVGAPGACDYASANAVLDTFVDADVRPAAWTHVLSVAYGAWREVGMAAKLVVPESQRKAREAFLRTAIAPDTGVDAFVRALASRRRRVVVVPFDLVDALAQAERELPVADAPAPAHDRPEISSAYEEPRTEVEHRLARVWSELLGVERIGVHDDFFELGGHSLLATRVIARIDEILGARLALRDIFDAPTIRRLCERVDAARPTGAQASAGAEPVDEEREELDF